MAKQKTASAMVALGDAKAWMDYRERIGVRGDVNPAAQLEGVIAKLKRQIERRHPKSKDYAQQLADLEAAKRGADAMGG
jgi:hypothetical protein